MSWLPLVHLKTRQEISTPVLFTMKVSVVTACVELKISLKIGGHESETGFKSCNKSIFI